jgi:hypothetical protein
MSTECPAIDAKKAATPWPIDKDINVWAKNTYYNVTGTQLECKVKQMQEEIRKRHAAIRALNTIIYFALSVLISIGFTFVVSSVAKMEWVHIVKIFWAVILWFAVKFVARFLQVDM